MVVVLYADVVLIVSELVCLPILWSCARAYGLQFKVWRAFAAGLLCGVGTVAAIWLKMSMGEMLAMYAFMCMLAACVAFARRENLRQLSVLARVSVMMLWYSAVVAGVCNIINSAVRGEVRLYTCVGCVVISVVLFCIVIRMRRSAYSISVDMMNTGSCTICLAFGNREFVLDAFADSGNLLTEPISGCPVAVIGDVERNKELIELICSMNNVRYVPFAALSGEGVLECVPARGRIVLQGRSTDIGDVYVGVSKNIRHRAVVGTAFVCRL